MCEYRNQGRTRRKNQGGFTLIEMMIALSIFAVGVLAVASMQTTASTSSNTSLRITETATLAMDRIESAIAEDYDVVVAKDGDVEEVGGYELEWNVQPDTPFLNVATVIILARRTERGRVRELQLTYFKQNI